MYGKINRKFNLVRFMGMFYSEHTWKYIILYLGCVLGLCEIGSGFVWLWRRWSVWARTSLIGIVEEKCLKKNIYVSSGDYVIQHPDKWGSMTRCRVAKLNRYFLAPPQCFK